MECIVNDLPIYYEEHGEGKPVLCLHGFAVDHRIVKGALEPIFLKQTEPKIDKRIGNYRRIYLDLPGMGQTPRRDWIENADVMLEVVKQFIAKVIGEEIFLLVGQSYGGYLALGLVLDPTLKIDGLFLIAPCVIADRRKRKLPAKRQMVVDPEVESIVSSLMDYEKFLDAFVMVTKENWYRFEAEILPGLRAADVEFLKGYRKRGYGFSFEPDLRRVKVEFRNLIYVMASQDDHVVGWVDVVNLLKGASPSVFAIVDENGHYLHIEGSDIFSICLQDWLLGVAKKQGAIS